MFEWYDRQLQHPAHQPFKLKLLVFGLCWLSMNSVLKSRSEWDAISHTAAELLFKLPATVTVPGPFQILDLGHWPVSTCL